MTNSATVPEAETLRTAALLARELAEAQGLPPDNLWEAPVARHLAADLQEEPLAIVRRAWRARLGLPVDGVLPRRRYGKRLEASGAPTTAKRAADSSDEED